MSNVRLNKIKSRFIFYLNIDGAKEVLANSNIDMRFNVLYSSAVITYVYKIIKKGMLN